jgi:hypothetical protein
LLILNRPVQHLGKPGGYQVSVLEFQAFKALTKENQLWFLTYENQVYCIVKQAVLQGVAKK